MTYNQIMVWLTQCYIWGSRSMSNNTILRNYIGLSMTWSKIEIKLKYTAENVYICIEVQKNYLHDQSTSKRISSIGLVFAKLVTFATKELVGLLKMGPPLAFGMIIRLVKALIIELSTPLKSLGHKGSQWKLASWQHLLHPPKSPSWNHKSNPQTLPLHTNGMSLLAPIP